MMGYYGNMMGAAGSFGLFLYFVLLVDLILLGVWLWKQVSKK